MRRPDLHPDRKLRNPARHLRQLARWPSGSCEQLPTAADLQGATEPRSRYSPRWPRSSPPPEVQHTCIAAMFAASNT